MPTPRTQQITSWSMSRYNDYKTCPAKAKYKHLLKLKEPDSPAMARGTAIHKLAEDYVKGKIKTLPPELKLFKAEFKHLRDLYKRKMFPMIVEDNWAFDKAWEACAWDDWAICWLRVKLDVGHYEGNILYITDHKTGKPSPYKNAEYVETLELYATAGLLMASIEDVIVIPRLWYLDEGVVFPPEAEQVQYTKADLPNLLKTWAKRVKPMLSDTKFAPRPNHSCQWCHYRKANNGPCKF